MKCQGSYSNFNTLNNRKNGTVRHFPKSTVSIKKKKKTKMYTGEGREETSV